MVTNDWLFSKRLFMVLLLNIFICDKQIFENVLRRNYFRI